MKSNTKRKDAKQIHVKICDDFSLNSTKMGWIRETVMHRIHPNLVANRKPYLSNYENIVRPSARPPVRPRLSVRQRRRGISDDISLTFGMVAAPKAQSASRLSSLLTHSTSTQGQVQFSFSSAPKPTTDAIVNVDGFWQPPRFYLSIRSFENVGKIELE